MSFYGERVCGRNCYSQCCYFEYGVGPVKDGYEIKKKEVRRLRRAVKKHLNHFLPEYQSRIKDIVESGKFILKSGKFGFLAGDENKPGFKDNSEWYFPCVFLDKPSCMIHPYKFQICKNTTEKDCL